MNTSSKRKPYNLTLRAVIFDNQKRFLLMRRSKNVASQTGCWELPGGKMDSGETIDKALKREILEETGFHVELVKVLGTAEWEKSEIRIAYLFFLADIVSGEFCISPEHDDYRWVPHDEDLKKIEISPQLRSFIYQLQESQEGK